MTEITTGVGPGGYNVAGGDAQWFSSVQQYFDRSLLFFPAIFMNPFAFTIPNIKTLFKWAEFLILTDGLIQTVTNKLAAYPVTSIIIESKDEVKKKILEDVFDKLNIRNELISANINEFTYGNCFISLLEQYTRKYVCKGCKGEFVSNQIKDLSLTENNYISGLCPREKVTRTFESLDTKREFDINDEATYPIVMSWNPSYVDIDASPFSNVFYKLEVSNILKPVIGRLRAIRSASDLLNKNAVAHENIKLLDSIPSPILQALSKKLDISFNTDKLFHLKRAGLPGWNKAWGMPLITSALRDIYTYYITKKSLETILRDRILSYRILYPEATSTVDPARMINLQNYKNTLIQAFNTWQNYDPSQIQFLPTPVGFQLIGGEGTPIQLEKYLPIIEELIIRDLGVPKEFVYGGMQWSATSITIRLFENTLRNIMRDDIGMLMFLKKRLGEIIGINFSDVNIRLSDVRSADDIQRQRILFDLNAAGKIPDQILFKSLDLPDQEDMVVMLEHEAKNKQELYKKIGELNNINTLEAAEGQGKAQVDSQYYADIENKALGIHSLDFKILPPNLQQLVTSLYRMDDRQKKLVLAHLQQEAPATYDLVMKHLTPKKPTQTTETGQQDKKSLPEEKPPRRDVPQK
jgi:hypothetical protein